jgi:hypothetical protein
LYSKYLKICGLYPSVYGRIRERYVTLFLQSRDARGIVVGASGAFLVLLKVPDMTKNKLAGTSKNN